MSGECDTTFRSMGSDVRLIIGPALLASAPPPWQAAEAARSYVERFAARLSRFSPASELSALNRDPRAVVPASPLLRAAVRAAVWGAETTGGLVDPTLTRALERAGYESSMDGVEPVPLVEALAAAPERRAARPDPSAAWRQIAIDDERGVVRRPPGLVIDTGGTGKGLCADAVAAQLAKHTRYVVDCGGDLAVGGVDAQLHPWQIDVAHPLSGEIICALRVASGGVATSGLNVRIWLDETGYHHHLLDPSTGSSAWTGLIGVTALGSCALEAEVIAKEALLRGEAGARAVLARYGGLIVREDGDVEQIGPVEAAAGRLARAGAGA
jgi:thiamine biosynthesis lipoprotein